MKKNFFDYIEKVILAAAAGSVVLLMLFLLGHMVMESLPAFSEVGMDLFRLREPWHPVGENPSYGLMPMIAGTLYVSGLAVLFALVFGICCAVFLNFYVPKKLAKLLLSFIELVAGIPSVIFGFIGLTVLVKWFAEHLEMAAGQSVLAASMVLAVMLLPFVVSTCSESIEYARREYELPALALGFSKETFIARIVCPAIRKGMIAAAMMAFGRGLGETMAVMMVIGNSPIFPKLLGRGQTLPALTALEMGSIEYGSIHLSVLYAANVILLIILFVIMACGRMLQRRAVRHEA